MRAKRIVNIAAAGAVVGSIYVAVRWRRTMRQETERLAKLLGWQRGAAVADVGAGAGRLALAAARRVDGAGRVFAAEIDPKKLRKLRRRTRKRGNVEVVEAEAGRTGLPAECCDAILLRGSYHHFTDPAAITQDLYRALRPGGIVAAIDFPPKRWLTILAPVKGAPTNRGGHGIRPELLIEEMTAAGFEVQERIPRWLPGVYCIVFRKPLS